MFFLPGGTQQAKYLSYYGVKENKMINAQMTVDVDYIKRYVSAIKLIEREKIRAKNAAQNEDIVFLYVGRLLDWKGVRELISAIQVFNDCRVKLWIVGSGTLANEVELAAKECERIVYFGRVIGDLLWTIYHAADVFILPSHWEPWGLVVNEAMAAGKPVIVTDTVGCVADLVFNNQTGLVIKPKNVILLGEAIRHMLENPIKRNRMAVNALNHISNWTLRNEAKNMIDAWKKVL
ncbi:MAG: glycosyltransferase family 4 protein [Gammaproteobacteria bacterium]|nr:glycosyltransferase family 4 protein [Gammaproteobacteria bacterium]